MKVQTPQAMSLEDTFKLSIHTPDGPIPLFFVFCEADEWEKRAESKLAGWRIRRIGPFLLAVRQGG